MFEFTDSERYSLKQARALSTDDDGNEVLVGLTVEETRELMEDSRKFSDEIHGRGMREHDPAIRRRCALLQEKHNLARLAVIGAEAQLKNIKPTTH